MKITVPLTIILIFCVLACRHIQGTSPEHFSGAEQLLQNQLYFKHSNTFGRYPGTSPALLQINNKKVKIIAPAPIYLLFFELSHVIVGNGLMKRWNQSDYRLALKTTRLIGGASRKTIQSFGRTCISLPLAASPGTSSLRRAGTCNNRSRSKYLSAFARRLLSASLSQNT